MFSFRTSIFLNKLSSTFKKTINNLKHFNSKTPLRSKLMRTIPTLLVFLSAPSLCDGILNKQFALEIEELSKPELVEHLNSEKKQDFIVIIYDKFKRHDQAKFVEELQPLLDQCKKAKIKKVYLIDSSEVEHLRKMEQILKENQTKNPKQQLQAKKSQKRKSFQCFFKSKTFSEAIQLQNTPNLPISKQISQIKHFQPNNNSENINQIISKLIKNPYDTNETIVVKQCLNNDVECVESFKRQIKKLIDEGMLNGKKDSFKFQLIIDYPTGIRNTSSQYIRNFVKSAQSLRGKPIPTNRKQQAYIFRRDLFGNDVSIYSEWLQKQGVNYSNNQRFLMFLKPRCHIITKSNTYTDLMWFFRAARLNSQVSISLNNTLRFSKYNTAQTLDILRTLHFQFSNLNYLIVNSDQVKQLIRHINADYKYVIFKQDSNPIWSKQFLNLDKLEKIKDQAERKKVFDSEFKSRIEEFIDNPQIKDYIQMDKQLQITLQRLRCLKQKQENRKSKKRYVVRVCKDKCQRNFDEEKAQMINNRFEEPTSIYWIDSTAQNIGVKEGDYILKDGLLESVEEFLKNDTTNN